MKWLLDTNIVSEWMRRNPDPTVLAWGASQEGFAVSAITVEELYTGLRHRKLDRKEEWLERFLKTGCQVLPVDATIARRAGTMRGRFLESGATRHPADMMIAATALLHGLTLVTRNTRDFEECGVPLLDPFVR